jgi:hypothetical protein
MAVVAAVGPVARHQIAGEAAFRLGEHKERVAHWRRHEPLVAGNLDVITFGYRLGDVGAHVGAALALGHAHAERDALLHPPRQRPGVVVARLNFRQPFLEQSGLGPECADAGVRHGDGAKVAALGLGREVEAHGPADEWSLRLTAVVRRGVDAVADALFHQRMIGRVKFDEVEAVALAVHRPELGRILVGDAAEVERRRCAIVASAGRQCLGVEAKARSGIGKWPVGREQVDVAEGRRLIEGGVFEQAGGHPE